MTTRKRHNKNKKLLRDFFETAEEFDYFILNHIGKGNVAEVVNGRIVVRPYVVRKTRGET